MGQDERSREADVAGAQTQWYEIQDAVAYYPLFEQPKIVYPEIAKSPRFYLDVDSFYTNNKLFLIPGENWYLLAVLNSQAAFNALKLKLSSLGDADEGGRLELRAVHIQHLPIPAVEVSSDEDAWSRLRKAYEEAGAGDLQSSLFPEVVQTLETGHADQVAAFLGFLARKMQHMHEERLEIEDAWTSWVEQEFSGAKKLGKEWLREGWVQDGLEGGVEAVLERFREKKVSTTPQSLIALRKHTEQVLEELRPLYHRIQATDRLIDQIVYRLYGLTEDEIAIVEGKKGS